MHRHRPLFAGFLTLLALLLASPSRVFGGPSPTPAPPEPPKLKLPAVAAPTGYSVELSIDPSRKDFGGSVSIDLRLKEKTSVLWLNATELEVKKASVLVGDRSIGAKAVPGGDNFVGFSFDRPVGPGNRAAAGRVHGQARRVLDAGTLSREGRRGLVRLLDVRGDRRAPGLPLLRRAGVQGALAADAADSLGHDRRLEHADRGGVRGGRRRTRRALQEDRAAAELPRRPRRRPVRLPRRRDGRIEEDEGPHRHAARQGLAGTLRRPDDRSPCSSGSRPTSACPTRTRSSTTSRSRRPSRSAPRRTRA